jgi:hypothetical protein
MSKKSRSLEGGDDGEVGTWSSIHRVLDLSNRQCDDWVTAIDSKARRPTTGATPQPAVDHRR